MSYANQKTIIIHQSTQIPFLRLGVDEMFAAYRTIKTPSSFVFYLYLASNKEGYRLELSKEAFENQTGLSKSSYHRAIEHLTQLGYIYEDASGRLNFMTVPKEGVRTATQAWDESESGKNDNGMSSETAKSQDRNATYSRVNTEINSTDNNKENKKTNNASRSSTAANESKGNEDDSKDYSYLNAIIDSCGRYISGDKKGKWLEDEVPHLWQLKGDELYRDIAKYAGFTIDEAVVIGSYILDHYARFHAIRLEDFYQDTSIFCDNYKEDENEPY